MTGSSSGVSITLSYMLTLGIASLFVLGMLGYYYSIVAASSNTVSYHDLRSISGMLILNLDQFQRLARASMSSGLLEQLEYNLALPTSAAAQSYLVKLGEYDSTVDQYPLQLSTRDVAYQIPLKLKLNASESLGSSIAGIRLSYRIQDPRLKLE